jgi:hypothetical protein
MSRDADFVVSELDTPVGGVAAVATRLSRRDLWGTFKVRWGWGRMSYRVTPGLYAVGKPNAKSPVLVSANYKLSFDTLRKELGGIDAWVLVVDTNGINVWCSAGKGTFSTDCVVRGVEATRLSEVVSKRRLILPQLAAPGVAADEVRKRTGFYVSYGPVRARDLPQYLSAGLRATDEMRRVTFTTRERMVLVPVELVHALKPIALIVLAAFVIAGFDRHGFHFARAWQGGWPNAIAVVGAAVAGMALTPLLLPWIPGRAFSLKGALMGLAWVGAWMALRHAIGLSAGPALALAHALVLVPLSSFLALGFTGCTSFTSLSGVQLETRRAIPLMIASAVVGAVWLLVALFRGGLA